MYYQKSVSAQTFTMHILLNDGSTQKKIKLHFFKKNLNAHLWQKDLTRFSGLIANSCRSKSTLWKEHLIEGFSSESQHFNWLFVSTSAWNIKRTPKIILWAWFFLKANSVQYDSWHPSLNTLKEIWTSIYWNTHKNLDSCLFSSIQLINCVTGHPH